MDASVIVCTYNRADSLKDTINALKQQNVGAEISWEIIVVDNNSKDHTKQLVQEEQKSLPRLRYLFEKEQGLSYARNLGLSSANGNILLFTDDDVLPEPNWLASILEGMEKYNADACGGYIAPIWETPPPNWLTDRFYGFLAVRIDRTDDYQLTHPDQAPFGANMAFKKEIFQHVGNFDTTRGRSANILAGGEDIEMFERVLSAHRPVFFLGSARVHHKVESFRLKKTYFRKWRLESSRNIAQTVGVPGETRLFNIPLYIFPQLVRATLRLLFAKLLLPKDEAFQREIIVFHFMGTIIGLYSCRASATK